jgi:hypothetical protein
LPVIVLTPPTVIGLAVPVTLVFAKRLPVTELPTGSL